MTVLRMQLVKTGLLVGWLVMAGVRGDGKYWWMGTDGAFGEGGGQQGGGGGVYQQDDPGNSLQGNQGRHVI